MLSVIGLGIGSAIAYYQLHNDASSATVYTVNTTQAAQTRTPNMAGVQLGGDFTLQDHTGKTITQNDYAGMLKLIYFGFTYCPAICPTELQKMAASYEMLEDDIKPQIAPLFITVDPDRDTVTVMRDYVEMFHPAFVGLRGTPEQTEDIKKKYRVFATKVQDESLQDYTVDHSSFIYLMSADNKPLMIFRMEDGADMIAAEIRKALKGDF